MRAITTEWVAKAEGDYALVVRESRVRKRPFHDAVCFHAQQCAEKYLKARLVQADIDFPKVHALLPLLDLARAVEPLWDAFREDLAQLSTYAVAFRYPGQVADRALAKDALRRCRRFRRAARAALGLESQ